MILNSNYILIYIFKFCGSEQKESNHKIYKYNKASKSNVKNGVKMLKKPNEKEFGEDERIDNMSGDDDSIEEEDLEEDIE